MSRMWRLGWIVGALSGAIACPTVTLAQSAIVEDQTLGNESSQVIRNVNFNGRPTEFIIRGAERGQNVFHSLREFNVDPGRAAYFFVPNSVVRNILTRVTGSNPSQIFGRMGTFQQLPNGQFATAVPNVNLFLLNPNGILFGPGARLDVGGSFVATTTNGLKFGNVGEFSATDPQPPSALLTINPSAFFVNRVRPRPITVNQTVLGVPTGKSLMLVGGDVVLEGGQLNARGGRVNVGSVAGAGRVEILPTGDLGFATGLTRGNVVLTNAARLNVRLNGGGEIGITSGSIWLVGGSVLLAGMNTAGGNTTSRAGDVRLDATGTILLAGVSAIENILLPGITGNAGNVEIRAAALEVMSGSQLSVRTFGQGNAGNIVINARDDVLFQNGDVFSSVTATGIGQGGNVEISTGSLEVRDGAQLIANTYGQGDAGNIVINARDRVLFQGASADGQFASAAFSSVWATGIGQSGNVEISTGSLEVRDGAQLITSTGGKGNAGNVIINAHDRVLFQGGSAAITRVEATGRGQGGNVQISTGSLEVRDGAQLTASTVGTGNAGSVIMNVRDRVLFQNSSAAFTRVANTGIGKGGNVQISTGSLEMRDGAQLGVATQGWGDAGNIVVNARNLVLFQGRSAAITRVEATGRGQGGNVQISTGSLEVRDGAALTASTLGTGNAGNVIINARDRVLFQNGDVFSSVTATGIGQGGNVQISTGSLEVRDGAQLITSTGGKGNAGNVIIHARDRILLDGTDPADGRSSAIFTNNGQRLANGSAVGGTGRGGDVSLTTPQLQVSNGGVVDAKTANDKPGGNITLSLSQLNLLNGGQILSTSDGNGPAGTIIVNASDQIRISGTDPTYAPRLAQFDTAVAPVSANSGLYVRASSSGSAGNILLTTPLLTLDQQGRIDAESASGNGGNIILNASQLLLMRNGSRISTNAGTAQAGGDGGNITIDSPNGFIVGVLRENSDITANAFTGSGGNVTITAQGIYGLKFQPRLTPNSDITASSEFGFSGTVTLNIPDTDPSRGFISLPVDLTDPTTRLDTRCQPGSRGYASSYIETGRGGVPQNPEDPLIDETVSVGWAEVRTGRRTEEGGRRTEERRLENRGQMRSPETEIIEAQAIGRDRQGHLWLVAETNQPKQFVPPECQNQRP